MNQTTYFGEQINTSIEFIAKLPGLIEKIVERALFTVFNWTFYDEDIDFTNTFSTS